MKIRIDIRIRTSMKLEHDRPNIFVYEKEKKIIWIIEIGVTNQDFLQQL